jgi:hypothetical protein
MHFEKGGVSRSGPGGIRLGATKNPVDATGFSNQLKYYGFIHVKIQDLELKDVFIFCL